MGSSRTRGGQRFIGRLLSRWTDVKWEYTSEAAIKEAGFEAME